MKQPPSLNPLPRELAPGVFWLGDCLARPFEGRSIHIYNSAYVVVGARHSAFIETGMTCDTSVVLAQFDQLLAGRAIPPPRYLLPTHSEMAHAGGTGVLLARYPEATVHGDITDLHLVFPEFSERMYFAHPGDRFDLGDTEIVVVESVFRDLLHSRWYFDTKRRILFPGDGFSYAHYHTDDACGHLAEEVPTVDIGNQMAHFALATFHWTQFIDIEPYIQQLRHLIFAELDAQLIAPTHGLPIGNPVETMPLVEAGFRAMKAEA